MTSTPLTWIRAAAGLLAVACLGSPAAAVIISGANDAANIVAPSGNPGWNNMGRVLGGSAVYLGNRWVLTAAHVGAGPMRLNDGRQFGVSFQTEVQLQNPAALRMPPPDLLMFRLDADPGLPALTIPQQFADVGDSVMMIGAGRDRLPQLVGWQYGETWVPAPLPASTVQGFNLASTSTMRWGMNTVVQAAGFRFNESTPTFATRFDQLGGPFEAQATSGDSGGGVFRLNGQQWELLGIMTSVERFEHQPDNTTIFLADTYIAEVAFYRDQIMELVDKGNSLWQNPANRFDVSRSGGVSPHDFLLIVNRFLRGESSTLEGAPGARDYYYDVNGDFLVSPADALQIVNFIASQTAGASAARSARALTYNPVPEPSSLALAASGLLLGLLAARRLRRRAPR